MVWLNVSECTFKIWNSCSVQCSVSQILAWCLLNLHHKGFVLLTSQMHLTNLNCGAHFPAFCVCQVGRADGSVFSGLRKVLHCQQQYIKCHWAPFKGLPAATPGSPEGKEAALHEEKFQKVDYVSVTVLFILPQKSAILTTVGVLEQPLGNARLHVARLVAALLQTSDPSICQGLCNLSTMDVLLVVPRLNTIPLQADVISAQYFVKT